MLAKLRDGVDIATAQNEMQRILTLRDSAKIKARRGDIVAIKSLHDQLFGSARRPLSLMLGAVVMLLLIACANVASLSLARATSRRREFAVRLALGASRWRISRQLIIESAILAAFGGLLGALAPLVLVGAFVRLSPNSVAGVENIHVDMTVLLFTAVATTLSALPFGLAPAITGARSGASTIMASGNARMSSSKGHNFMRSALVVVEVSAALTLITGAGLLTKSFARALAINPGYRAENVYSLYLQLPSARYANRSAEQAFYNQLAERVRAIPGVELVSQSHGLPLSGFSWSRNVKRSPIDVSPPDIAFSEIDSTYAKTVGLHLIKGRFIDGRDVIGSEPVMMLTASAAKLLFPNGDAVGNRLTDKLDAGEANAFPIVVGVVDDVAQKTVEEKPMPQIFLSSLQRDASPGRLIVRTSLDKSTYQRALRGIVSSIDPLQPLTEFVSLQEALSESFAPRRFNSVLINAFAVVALILAMIGLYGLMANAVVSRTRELGIRMALGAQQANVMQLVLKQGLVLTGLGVAGGVILSYALSRSLASLLYDVDAHDATTFIFAPVILLSVALIACYFPARRATKVTPMVAIRSE